MPIDPEEIKIEGIKRLQKGQEIQNYLEKQDALDKEKATGKMGHRKVCKESVVEKFNGILEKALNFLKGK